MAVDYTNLLDEYETAFEAFAADAGNVILQNLPDRAVRVGLSIADWKPNKDMHAQAAEWWEFGWEYANSPDEGSEEFAFVVSSVFDGVCLRLSAVLGLCG